MDPVREAAKTAVPIASRITGVKPMITEEKDPLLSSIKADVVNRVLFIEDKLHLRSTMSNPMIWFNVTDGVLFTTKNDGSTQGFAQPFPSIPVFQTSGRRCFNESTLGNKGNFFYTKTISFHISYGLSYLTVKLSYG